MTALQLCDSPGVLGEGANRLGTAIARQGSQEVRLLSMNVMGGPEVRRGHWVWKSK